MAKTDKKDRKLTLVPRTLKVGDLVLNDKFPEAFKFLTTMNFPIKTSMKLIELSKEINEVGKIFEVRRRPILEKYAEKDANGGLIIENGNFKFTTAAMDGFNAEIAELLNENIELRNSISSSELKDIHISPDILAVLLNTGVVLY
jgi:hypothetical protein